MPAEEKQNQAEIRTLKTLLEWEAPSWFFRKRNKDFFSTVLTIAFLIIVILFFLKEWFAILAAVSLVFLVFVMGKIPPPNVVHKITTRGVVTGGKEYPWEQLRRFWFEEKDGKKILFVENLGFPKVLIMLLEKVDSKKIEEVLSNYLPQETLPKTWLDKASSWLSQKIPLEEKN